MEWERTTLKTIPFHAGCPEVARNETPLKFAVLIIQKEDDYSWIKRLLSVPLQRAKKAYPSPVVNLSLKINPVYTIINLKNVLILEPLLARLQLFYEFHSLIFL